ncbi:unnamed protein product [Orchesella dallaii]|uniref:Peptidase M13 N-terminal domain-containing protein n=1 Tax=Orchesella dallaii TaxID=48710 RepID=A0ABP1Q1Q2_9HEXA
MPSYKIWGTIERQDSIDALPEYLGDRYTSFSQPNVTQGVTKNDNKHSPERQSVGSGGSRTSHNHGRKKGREKKTSGGGSSRKIGSRRHSTTTAVAMPLEWYNFALRPGTFDLQLWWHKSAFGSRLNALIVAFLFVFALIHVTGAIFFITTHFTNPSNKNPYMCTSPDCKKAAKWMIETMDKKVDPCENFYEFVCGNDAELHNDLNYFSEYINVPLYKVEFGENSILAKILKSYSMEEEELNQPIKFYQACLDEPTRKKYGLTALVEAIHYAFETTDLSTFEKSPVQLEKVGERMFRVMGHAVYLNIAFHSYPYVERWPAVEWIEFFDEDFDKISVTSIFQNFLPHFGIAKDSPVVDEMVKAIEVMFNVAIKIRQLYIAEAPSSMFSDRVKSKLQGLCPLMGIKMNIKTIFDQFIGDNFKWDYLNPETLAYSRALQICFDEDQSKFNFDNFHHPKTALEY